MASISNIRLSATKAAGTQDVWDVTVRYTAKFSPFEASTANYTFRDGFVLWEDDTSDDDQLTGVVSISKFNPTSTVVERTLTHRISGDTLDTELGQEELYAKVRLRNLDLNLLYTAKSSVLHLSP